MNIENAIAKLQAFDLETLRSNLFEWPDVEEQLVERTVALVAGMRDDFVELIQTIDDEDEVDTTMAIQYVELKSRWIALNTKINYTTFRHGTCDASDALAAASVSAFLAEVESLLAQEDIDKITEFLAQPISKAA